MDDRQKLAVAVGMEYACHSMVDAAEKLEEAMEFDANYIIDIFISFSAVLRKDKVLHHWGRGIYRRK